MRRQLIIKVPDGAGSEEIKCMFDLNTKAYLQGQPLFLFPGWDYDLVEVSEPSFVFCEPSQTDREKFVDAMKKAKVDLFRNDSENPPKGGNVAQSD